MQGPQLRVVPLLGSRADLKLMIIYGPNEGLISQWRVRWSSNPPRTIQAVRRAAGKQRDPNNVR